MKDPLEDLSSLFLHYASSISKSLVHKKIVPHLKKKYFEITRDISWKFRIRKVVARSQQEK